MTETSTRDLNLLLDELCWNKEAVVQKAAARAGEVMRAHMTHLGVWETVDAADRAAVLWAIVNGPKIPAMAPERAEAYVRILRQLMLYVIGVCDPEKAYLSSRREELGNADAIYGRLTKLPEGWRREVLRRVLEGANLPSTIAEAEITINRLRAHGLPTEAPEPTATTAEVR